MAFWSREAGFAQLAAKGQRQDFVFSYTRPHRHLLQTLIVFRLLDKDFANLM
jgi:hypothetical protein